MDSYSWTRSDPSSSSKRVVLDKGELPRQGLSPQIYGETNMTDHSKESFNSIGGNHYPDSELNKPVWGVIYENGDTLTNLTYAEAREALTQPPNGTHAMVVTSEAAEKFKESKFNE
jgi:hypothetical protein